MILHLISSFLSIYSMGEVQIQVQEGTDATVHNQVPKSKGWQWWFKVCIYTSFVLAGQTIATLLGRFYFNEGGNSKWLNAFVVSAGFPILLPLLFFHPPSAPTTKKSFIYIGLGIMASADNLTYAYGLLYLPVSTFALVCATQLAFNAVFSYLLNSQKFTSLIFNSVVILTFSAALLGVNSDSTGSSVSKDKYPLGFILTLLASATFSLILSLTQLTFQKVIKRDDFAALLEMLVCTGFAGSVGSLIGLFASGEGSTLKNEMHEFAKGEVVYVVTLAATAVGWTLSLLGTVGLIMVVSSLFSNVISTFALPLVPIFAVVFFHDKMDGVKVVAMLMAVWGFLSYIYQDYLDDLKAKAKQADTEERSRSVEL